MEFLEHHTEDRTGELVQKAGRFGPFVGGIFGVVPQCGFSAAASSLYAGRVITPGTLIAIYLSTSDEMIPLLVSEQFPVPEMLRIIVIKAVIGVIAGFLVDLIFFRQRALTGEKKAPGMRIDELCRRENCHCEPEEAHIRPQSETDSGSPLERAKHTARHAKSHSAALGILRSALVHTLHIFIFVFIFSLMLNAVITLVGEDRLSLLLSGSFFASHILAGVVGLIPNCAASVVITEMYIDGLISTGTLLSGLLVGAGVGLLVLFRTNTDRKENIRLTLLLFFIGTVCGIAADLFMGGI